MSHQRAPHRLELKGIRKAFGSLLANDGIDLDVRPGEIHAVLGENGAGKSTLMKVIYGSVRADAGEIFWDGVPVHIKSPSAAKRLGIGMVYQHLSLFESVSVAENIAAALGGRYDLTALSQQLVSCAQEFGLTVDPSRLVYHLSIGERQQVELLRCLVQSPRLLILDEPTAVLAPPSVEALFATLRRIAARGCSILYISHKLDEVRALCTRATILRGGRFVTTLDPRESSAQQIARHMVGDFAELAISHTSQAAGSPHLRIVNLRRNAKDLHGVDLDGISLELAKGEVVGVAGVSGNGQGELFQAISGETPGSQLDRSIWLQDRSVDRLGPRERRSLGLACVPEDRLGRGAIGAFDLNANTLLTAGHNGLVRRGVVLHRRVSDMATRIVRKYDVRCSGGTALASTLSGGNLQKFIVGREIEALPEVLVVAQPTWGVDVAAAASIRARLHQMSRGGAAVLLISEDLEELLALCDRIYVMCAGRLSRSLTRQEMTPEVIGRLMMQREHHPEADDQTIQKQEKHVPLEY